MERIKTWKSLRPNRKSLNLHQTAEKEIIHTTTHVHGRNMICVTRVHCKSASTLVSIDKIIQFVATNSLIADQILICLGIGDQLEYVSYYQDLQQRIQQENLSSIVILQPICPWGGFTHSLNVAIQIALQRGYEKILFQSLEVSLSLADRDVLLASYDDKTLVVGPVLEGHEFIEGINSLRGRTSPWNTCAIWNVLKLSLVGFPLIGDGIPNEIPGGVEEVSAIAFAQQINSTWEAKLIKILPDDQEKNPGGPQWVTEFEDEQRRRYHEQKMASKDSRPASQMARIGNGISTGTVRHLVSSSSSESK